VQDVVEELVLVVPEPDARFAQVVHGLGNMEKMLEELGRDVLVHMVVLGELERDAHEVERVHRHPAGAVRLVDMAAGWQARSQLPCKRSISFKPRRIFPN
jgi:hypothetical protein